MGGVFVVELHPHAVHSDDQCWLLMLPDSSTFLLQVCTSVNML